MRKSAWWMAIALVGCGQQGSVVGGSAELPVEVADRWDSADADEGITGILSGGAGLCPTPQLADSDLCWVVPADGEVYCDAGAPVTVRSTADGVVLDVDLAGRSGLAVDVLYENAAEWVWNIGNSPTNNGWAGDASTTSYDSEAQILGSTLSVYASDVGGSGSLGDVANAIDPAWDVSSTTICDGFMSFASTQGSWRMSTDAIFQIDGDEPDAYHGGFNDTVLHLAFERVVAGGRVGTGVPVARVRIPR